MRLGRLGQETTLAVEPRRTTSHGCALMLRFLHSVMVEMVATRPENRILRELANADRGVYAKMVNALEPFALQRGTLLGQPRGVTDFSYFIESGIVSLVACTRNGSSVEVGLIGREGVAGIADALGNQPLPYTLVVQLPGLAYRV